MKKKVIVLLFIPIIFCITLFFVFSYSFLSITKSIFSDTILIESWISANEIEQIADKYVNSEIKQIIVIGRISDTVFFNGASPPSNWKYNNDLPLGKGNIGTFLWANSTLIVDPDKYQIQDYSDSLFIEINACGTIAKKRFPFFHLIVNGKHIAGSFTSDTIQTFHFASQLNEDKLQSVMICFDNDLKTKEEDRNLFLHSIVLNGNKILLNNHNATVIRRGDRMPTGFSSRAELKANYLNELGINNKIIKTVSYLPSSYNKTLSSAKAMKIFFLKNPTQSFNIFSSGPHARRTLFTYEKTLGKKYSIGIISLQPEDINEQNWWKSSESILLISDEFMSYFINLIELTLNHKTSMIDQNDNHDPA